MDYYRREGIWHLLRPGRDAYFEQFIQDYKTVRLTEGRGSHDPAYFRALPWADLSGKRVGHCRDRALTFRTLMRRVIEPAEVQSKHPLKIADLGAGNGWLSAQLAARGHRTAAVDLMINAYDGLGAHIYYEHCFTPIQAEFEALPFREQDLDIVIFNQSLHYAARYEVALQEALRTIGPAGLIIIADTAVYHDSGSGRQMVMEREAGFERLVGFPSNALPAENFLTYQRLKALATELGVRWHLYWPIPRWRWTVRRLRAQLRAQREPAQFPLIIGRHIPHE